MNALLAIDSAVQAERRLTLREIDELHRARAAIAELIEAAKHARVALYHAMEAARSQREKAGNKHAFDRIDATLRGMGAL